MPYFSDPTGCAQDGVGVEAVVVLDCDGVVFDTNDHKTRSFARVLEGYDAVAVSRFLAFQQKNFGLSRYKLFERFFLDFLKREFDQAEYAGLCESFAEHCREIYSTAEMTPLLERTLREINLKWPVFVASGSDEQELRQAFKTRGIDTLFQGIYGSPKPKHEILRAILDRGFPQARVFMVGDSLSDFEAASRCGVPFVFMFRFSKVREEMMKLSCDCGFPAIDTIDHLPQTIRSMVRNVGEATQTQKAI